MSKRITLFLIGLILLLAGFIVGALIFHNVAFPQLEILRLALMLFGALLTLLAVVVSLEKEAILNLLHPIQREAVLSDGGLTEDADTEQTIVKATEYSGILSVINTSSNPAMDVSLEIIGVSYKQGSDFKPFRLTKNCFVKINGTNTQVDIHAKTTPNAAQDNSPILVISGLEDMGLPASKTSWRLNYRLSHSKGASDIQLDIEWDGTWKNRKSEMQTCCTVKLS